MSEKKDISFSSAIQEGSSLFIRFPLIPVRGIPLMSLIAENWDSVWAFRPDPSDLLIATYPKAGTVSCRLSLYTPNIHVLITAGREVPCGPLTVIKRGTLLEHCLI